VVKAQVGDIQIYDEEEGGAGDPGPKNAVRTYVHEDILVTVVKVDKESAMPGTMQRSYVQGVKLLSPPVTCC
jgi:hypothetical protein